MVLALHNLGKESMRSEVKQAAADITEGFHALFFIMFGHPFGDYSVGDAHQGEALVKDDQKQ